jgi:site-specific DNA-methyltransferase (adenine-specific)
MIYKEQRLKDLLKIKKNITPYLVSSSDNALVVGADSLEAIKKIPSESVSLILTDPPYHATKKKNIYGDTHFKKDQCYLTWMEEYAKEWRRVLKPNGSIFCYCDSTMSARLEVMFSEYFNVLSHVVWTKPNEPGFDGWKGKMKKESLRQWYSHSERIIFAEPAIDGNLHRSPFASLLREYRHRSGLSGHQLTEMVGAYGKVNHGGAVSNWEAGRNTPSREQYKKICEAIISTGRVDEMPFYEDAIRPFSMNKEKEFTDVWNFPSVRPFKGKHPAEKPLDMLKHAIEASTNEGDIVLDCFGGSGSTMLAAMEIKRLSVSIEIEPQWINSISQKLSLQCNLNNQKFVQHKVAEVKEMQNENLIEEVTRVAI